MNNITGGNTGKNTFRVERRNEMVESVNSQNQVFHFIDLNYLKEDIFFHGWIGNRTDEQIKAVIEGHFIELFEKYRCTKTLIQNEAMTGSFSGLNIWVADYFMPKMISMGLKYNAVVLPKNLFAQLSVADWDNKITGFTSRNFKSSEEALTWLRSI